MVCRADYFAMGLLHMTNAVSFLNNDCKQVRLWSPNASDGVCKTGGPAFLLDPMRMHRRAHA